MGIKYKIQNQEFDSWTESQHRAVELLESDVEYVLIFVWNDDHKRWGLLQELNLKRGIIPSPHFNTLTLAPYYVKEYYEQH